MFEKSLVDLIRGLRNHKGSEAEYIQNAIKECRGEIRSQDMDLKATALLKLIYLEMFGYDMTWAAFNILEVMSSAKHLQKRVGYLAAVQSFRPDTEVLMLATNLLKKDLSSASIPTMMLPLITLPHIVTSSLALSIQSDLLPRLSHSQPGVRKKTIVTLYRLALVYPDTLRVAWPKVKERLLDDQENSSVIAATVNVVCELGWRRPQDFLSLAPRLFELLVEGGNNWMAIKIIKLFAVLTPLEPRLVKKLVRPLTNLIQTTSAMSLLYECINGIIQGGILTGNDGDVEQDEVAKLCIRKLREMIVVDGDPNLKYVALLAFNKIAANYPLMVSAQEDVILTCLDDPDLSIRLQALDLATEIVNGENLQAVVNRLLKQLSNEPSAEDLTQQPVDDEVTDMEQQLIPDKRSSEAPPLPPSYRRQVIDRILDMCAFGFYQNITDFEWYLEVLVSMVRMLPPDSQSVTWPVNDFDDSDAGQVASRIGGQLLDMAVRIKELRPETTKAAERLVLVSNHSVLFAATENGKGEILKAAAWIVGEYPSLLTTGYECMNSLIHESSRSLPHEALAVYVQAIAKTFAYMARKTASNWDVNQKMTFSLMLARIVDFVEKLASHPNLEVQERSVEYLELFRLASEAVSSSSDDSAPALLTTAIPSLFHEGELNPVASSAQRKVPAPSEIDLDQPINPNLSSILEQSQTDDARDPKMDEFEAFYHQREVTAPAVALGMTAVPVSHREEPEEFSYQSTPESPSTLARRKAERLARSKDDPFYIPPTDRRSGTSTPFHEILSRENGQHLDLDAIPIVSLQLDSTPSTVKTISSTTAKPPKKKRPVVKKFHIASDETIGGPDTSSDPASNTNTARTAAPSRPNHSLLTINSSNLLHSVSLIDDPTRTTDRSTSSNHHQSSNSTPNYISNNNNNNNHSYALDPADLARHEAEEAEMAAAVRQVERLRLEMQRNAEKVEVVGDGGEAVVVKKRRKVRKVKKVPRETGGDDDGNAEDVNGEEGGGKGEGGEIGESEVGTEAGVVADVVKKRRKKKELVQRETKEYDLKDRQVDGGTSSAPVEGEACT